MDWEPVKQTDGEGQKERGQLMLSDYLDYGAGEQERKEGSLQDMWGTVLSASEGTEKGNVRVRVKLMEDKMDVFDNVPVLSCHAGDDHGLFLLPEEGDTVRLAFPGGDLRHPVVTGCRFPGRSRFLEDMCRKEEKKSGFLAKNGSSVLFSGEKGRELIQVSGAENMSWRLDEEKQQTSVGDKAEKNQLLLDKKQGAATIKAETSVRLECGKSSLELREDGRIVLHCEELTLEAKNIRIRGNTRVQISGQELALDIDSQEIISRYYTKIADYHHYIQRKKSR